MSQVVDVVDWVVWEVLLMLLLEKLLGFLVQPENHSNVRRYGMVPIPVQVVPVPVPVPVSVLLVDVSLYLCKKSPTLL